MEVLKAINSVQAAMAIMGIGKDRKNQAQGYSFRGIDDVYNEFAPLLAKAKLIVIPSYSDRVCVERENAKGTALFYVTVCGHFTFRSADDGSEIKAGPFYGEAMDSGDKATNKAMSAAMKYCFMQTFTVPTEGEKDTEAHTHEVKPKHNAERPGDGSGKITPTTGAWDAMSAEEQTFLQGIADQARSLFADNDPQGAWEYIEGQKLMQDECLALWTRLDSKERAALKKIGPFTMHFQKEAA